VRLTMTAVDNTLDLIDQASFLGLRALGHGPLIQYTWTYSDDVDLDGLRRFRRNLAHGLLGRRIERSPLPFGRHRWVAWPGPVDIEVAQVPLPRSEITDWLDEQALSPVDPEHGPSWRLLVQPLVEGGAVVTLVVSHTIGDGVGIALAVADAANGVTRDLGYPPPGTRSRSHAVRQDARRFLRDIPAMAKALAAAVALARNNGLDGAAPNPNAAPNPRVEPGTSVARDGDREVIVPSVTVRIDGGHWDARAAELGGSAMSLALAFSARLGRRLGWVASDGSVVLSVPVNERVEGDTRGNALTGVRLTVDPDTVQADLSGLRSGLKRALSTLADARHELLAPLPLTPMVPKALARRLEGVVGGTAVIGCSNLGKLDPAVNRPDGTEADFLAIRMAEHITVDHLRRFGGTFFPVVFGRVHGAQFVSIGYCDADGTTTRDELAAVTDAVLDDFGLTGTIE
jgi:diacylglycerol O-acyltransferase